MDSERIWIQTYLSSWNEKWVNPQTDPLRRWWFRYLSARSRLVGILRVAKARQHPGPWTDQMKADLVFVSTDLLEGCLSHERAMHMLRPTSPIVFAAAILLQLTSKDAPERDLILRVALRLAGEPRQEDIVTYAVHNGYQILNMLCLSRESTNVNVRPSPIDSSLNTAIYDQPSVSSSNYSVPSEENSFTQHMQPIPTFNQNQRLESIPSLTNQPFDDIDQLLGFSGNNGNIGNMDLSQWPNLNSNSNSHNNSNNENQAENLHNNVWSNFLSTDPITNNDFQNIPISDQNQNGYLNWTNNGGGEDPFNLVGGRQMSDNDISDFYFHLASALGS